MRCLLRGCITRHSCERRSLRDLYRSPILPSFPPEETFTKLVTKPHTNVILSAAKNPRRFIKYILALRTEALDSSLRYAPFRMTVGALLLGTMQELFKGLQSRNPERFIRDYAALRIEALDSSLRCAPFGMTVKAHLLGRPLGCPGLAEAATTVVASRTTRSAAGRRRPRSLRWSRRMAFRLSVTRWASLRL